MQKKLQVFVSSTYTDLKTERQAVVDSILRAKHIPAGMELFTAGDDAQLDVIRQWIDDSDVFMLVLGGRYGSVEKKSGKSYIELEYEYAAKKKKPLFCAVASDSYLKQKANNLGLEAIEKLNGQKLEDFKQVVTKKLCGFFDNVDQLKLIVFQSLSDIEKKHDLPGWISGLDVVNPKPLLEENAKLKEENDQLREEIDSFELIMQRSDHPESIAEKLSKEAKSLLVVSVTEQKHIVVYESGFSYQIHLDNELRIKPADLRQQALWRAVIDELLQYKLIQKLSDSVRHYQPTNIGHKVADFITDQSPSTLLQFPILSP